MIIEVNDDGYGVRWQSKQGDDWKSEYIHELIEYYEKYNEESKKHILSETDLLELEHRYGKEVRSTVEDMLSGKEERWKAE